MLGEGGLQRSLNSFLSSLCGLLLLPRKSLTARAINALVSDTELRFQLAPSLAEVDDLRARLEGANHRLARLERRKLEYEQRVRRHIEVDRRAELNFMMHLVAANDLLSFLKWEVRRVATSKEEAVATAVKEARTEMAAKLEAVKDKFRRKEAKITAEIHLQERLANLQLLKDLSVGKTTISEEMKRLTAEHRLRRRPWPMR
ncbi:unnamed protein product [Arabis nemorensis]|uniref:Uncharacterized protein n=1 Tax=Arabis nemorensis TaxID=586526 RepID=A0A565AVC6_9BRAS|nr:unnamed protein product [Arabis nemorensis]